MDFDTSVKLSVYQTVAQTARIPDSSQLAEKLSASISEVEVAIQNLHAKRLLVPEPGDPSRIRMAPPFSGVETAFPVHANNRIYFANCVWDALGIAAALKQDASIPAGDGFTGEPVVLEVRKGSVQDQKCVIHFAVPAALWWKHIIYT